MVALLKCGDRTSAAHIGKYSPRYNLCPIEDQENRNFRNRVNLELYPSVAALGLMSVNAREKYSCERMLRRSYAAAGSGRMGDTAMSSGETILERRKVREVAAVFHSAERLEDAIGALLLAGFDRGDIDIMGDIETVRDRLGALYVPAKEIVDVPGTPRRAYIARDDMTTATAGVAGLLFYIGATAAAITAVASGGSLALVAAAAAAAGAVGGGIAAAAIRTLGKKQAEQLELQLMSGGIVLWVRARDAGKETEAQEILAKSGGESIRVHEIEIDKRLEDLPLAKVRPDPWLGSEPLGRVEI